MSMGLENTIQEYQQQVLRWNRQINLVSRKDPLGNLAGLVRQCREAWAGLSESPDFPTAGHLWYFDLGSGGGLPGFVWHALAVDAGLEIATWLVEPREKRAWFLDRLNGLLKDNPTIVLDARWGDISDFGPNGENSTPSTVLISLKALHLTDSQVLRGLVPALDGIPAKPAPVKVIIARFYPPEQAWTAVLAKDLEIPTAGGVSTHGDRVFEGQGGTILPPNFPAGASLVISEYSLKSS